MNFNNKGETLIKILSSFGKPLVKGKIAPVVPLTGKSQQPPPTNDKENTKSEFVTVKNLLETIANIVRERNLKSLEHKLLKQETSIVPISLTQVIKLKSSKKKMTEIEQLEEFVNIVLILKLIPKVKQRKEL